MLGFNKVAAAARSVQIKGFSGDEGVFKPRKAAQSLGRIAGLPAGGAVSSCTYSDIC
jgi:hypothetical protein